MLLLHDALDVARAVGLHGGHAIDVDVGAHSLEDHGHVPLAVDDSRLHGAVGPAELIGQEGAVLEVVVGLDGRHLEVVGDQQHLQLVVLKHLAGDEVEHGGAGLHADAVVDDAGATAVLGSRLVHGVVGIQNPEDVGRHTNTEVAVGAVASVLQLQGALVQEGDELTLQPLEVAIGEVGRSIEGELSDVLIALIQSLLEPLVLHTGADHGDILGHRSHHVGVGEVLDGVGDIGPHFLRQAHLDVRAGGHHKLLEVVAEGGVDGMGVLLVGHGGIEVHLLDTLVAADEDHGGLIEVQLGGHVSGIDGAILLLDVQQQVHGVLTGAEVGLGTLSDGNVLLRNHLVLAIKVNIGARKPNVTVDAEPAVHTLQQRNILAVHLQTFTQSIDHDLGPGHEGLRSVGRQSVDQILILLLAGSADSGNDLFDLHGLLVDGAGVEQTMQHSLIRDAHGGGDARGQGDQVGHQGRLVHLADIGDSAGLDQVVIEHLSNALGVLTDHLGKVIVDVLTVVLVHQLHDALGHRLDLDRGKSGTGNGFIYDGTVLEPSDDVSNVAAFRSTAKQNAHVNSPFKIVI